MAKSNVQSLLADLDGDLKAIAQLANEIHRLLEQNNSHALAYTEAIALGFQIHNFYNAVENSLLLIIRFFENNVDGWDWHAQLLRRSQQEKKGFRPAILQGETAASLDEFKRFRHLYRHAYDFVLDSKKIITLAQRFALCRSAYETDMIVFKEFLTCLEGAQPVP